MKAAKCAVPVSQLVSRVGTYLVLQDVSSSSVVAVGRGCLLAQAGQALRQHHLAGAGGGGDRHPGVDHRSHWDRADPSCPS